MSLPSSSIAVFWTDLLIQPLSQRVFPEHVMSWTVDSSFGYRRVMFEWKAKVLGTSGEGWMHVTVIFKDPPDSRDYIDINYLFLSGTAGEGATVGMQDKSKFVSLLLVFRTSRRADAPSIRHTDCRAGGRFQQISFNQPNIPSGKSVIFNTAANTHTQFL